MAAQKNNQSVTEPGRGRRALHWLFLLLISGRYPISRMMSVEGPERRSWSESISVASTDAGRCRYRRSASVSCLRPGRPEVRRREGVRLGLAPTPSAFAESVLCYVGGAIGQSVISLLISNSHIKPRPSQLIQSYRQNDGFTLLAQWPIFWPISAQNCPPMLSFMTIQGVPKSSPF